MGSDIWWHVKNIPMMKIDQYAIRSGLFKVNPDLKVISGILFLFLCMISTKWLASILIGAGMVFMVLKMGRVPWRAYWRLLMIPLTFIVLSGVVLLVDVSRSRLGFLDIPFWGIYLSVTKESMAYGLFITGKALTGITCLYMISLSTPLYEIIGVLRRWHVPQIVIELMYLMYRFIFIVMDSYERMNIAAATRLGYSNRFKGYSTFFGICANLLVISFQRASKSFDAMESRCYDGSLMFLEEEKPVTGTQKCLFTVCLVLVVLVLVGERMWL